MKRPVINRATMKDVAREANVSPSTVSYVINDNEHAQRFTDATKQRVLDAVHRLGYKFNPIGRALQRGYTNQVILLIVTWDLATSHSATAMAISRAAIARDFELTVHVADSNADAEAFLKRQMLHNTGGILVLWDSPAMRESCLNQLAAEGVPVVDLLPDSPPGISTVTPDREDAFLQGTKYLIGLGHRRIGLISDSLTRPKTTLCKVAGYRRALEAARLKFDESLVVNITEFGFDGGVSGFASLLQRNANVTAAICINDAIAMGAIAAAADAGRQCPKDFSVVGFGDSAMSKYSRPALTTFALSANRVAEASVGLIFEQRQGLITKYQTIMVPEELIVRQSSGPAPK
ncbi:MAG: HTH-type transcriptional repressor CytR [Pedosphaera sp.]|nr:HTH-type transcriptional repressor CytR [Pedosphaera sp.]